MRDRLRLLRPERVTDGFGSEKTVYAENAVVRAERRNLSGSYGMEVGERFPDYHAEFNIRDAHEVDENWRAEQLGGHLYTVTSVVPNRARGMLTLKCERVNE